MSETNEKKAGASKDNSTNIVVCGDVVIDRFTASCPPNPEEKKYQWQTHPRSRLFEKPGGAFLLAEFLENQCGDNIKIFSPGIQDNLIGDTPVDQLLHSIISLDKFPKNDKDTDACVYRVKKHNGFSNPANAAPPIPKAESPPTDPDILVMEDSGNGLRDLKAKWEYAPTAGQAPLIILKVSPPFLEDRPLEFIPGEEEKGEEKQIPLLTLWEYLRRHHAERLVLVVDADDLRHEGARIGRCLSWEQTATDFVRQMLSNPGLLPLNNCCCLIVRFGVEGAILHRRREGNIESRLFYDPQKGEESYRDKKCGRMQGLDTCFTASITASAAAAIAEYEPENHDPGDDGKDIYEIIRDKLHQGIHQGLIHARRLYRAGFGKKPEHLDYPGKDILFKDFEENEENIFNILIPAPHTPLTGETDRDKKEKWSILKDLTENKYEGVARDYVIDGKNATLEQAPAAKFGDLTTLDRSEIEAFHGIRNLIREYRDNANIKRPLCIAVFGKPGSGKSFGVTEVANSIAPGEIEKVEFNLSQFKGLDELVAAFHRIRDLSLGKKLPLVFFDEFDAELNGQKLGWLKYFLAPMQDGDFREGEAVHPIGRAIFVFAGGTGTTYEEFASGPAPQKNTETTPKEIDTQDNDKKQTGMKPQDNAIMPKAPEARDANREIFFKNAKGPDFLSRLRGFVNIKGPDKIDDRDNLYVIRRALVLRHHLQKKAPHLKDTGKKISINFGVLRALLTASNYKHGFRSMEAIVEMSMLAGRKTYEQAALPSIEQLNMHVDAQDFLQRVMREELLGDLRDELGQKIHENYRKRKHPEAGSGPEEKDEPKDDALQEQEEKESTETGTSSNVPWPQLPEKYKESNRQQADDIPAKLEIVNCGFRKARDKNKIELVDFSPEEIEKMAILEHQRWCKERLLTGWTLGEEKNDDENISPYLVPWDELPEKEDEQAEPAEQDNIKELDRDAVRRIPEILKEAGFEVYPL